MLWRSYILSAVGLLTATIAAGQPYLSQAYYETPYVEFITRGEALPDILAQHGLRPIRIQPRRGSDETIVVAEPATKTAKAAADSLALEPHVSWSAPILRRPRALRTIPNDQFFLNFQWYLHNTGQGAGLIAGNDANIASAWDIATGTGVPIAIVDDGIDPLHEDLAPNLRMDWGIDPWDGDFDATPTAADEHGTNVAGLVAAKGANGAGIAGAAFDATLVPVRLVVGPTTDMQEAGAFAHGIATDAPVFISNNSWGPTDDGLTLEGPGPLALDAFERGVYEGRDGKGIVYIWAGGNGRSFGDNANYDGYANSRYTIAVGATGGDGLVTDYSEPGACILVNAPSAFGPQGVLTTDLVGAPGLSVGAYTGEFGGTSTSAAIVSGVAALMLERRPELTWRDVQHILAETAVPTDLDGGSWQTNGAGKYFSHDYGFGRVDAAAAVALAESWVMLPVESQTVGFNGSSTIEISEDAQGFSSLYSVNVARKFRVESVELTLGIDHPAQGELEIQVEHDGFTSVLAEPHEATYDYSGWTFRSVAHLREHPNGEWTVRVRDRSAGNTGFITSRALRIHLTRRMTHDADSDQSGRFSLSEMLRVVQFYNTGGYHCAPSLTADGYAAGAGPQNCSRHDADYEPQDWQISLREVLRLVQLYNMGGYRMCTVGEDGFCPPV